MSFRQRPYGVLQRTLVGLMLVISQAALAAPVTVVPASVSKDCRGGEARIYDECSDQSELLAEALQLAVLASTGFDAASVEVVPQVLVVDGRGTFVAGMDDYSSIAKLEVREDSGREYRGFDRPTLLRELVALREAALAVGSGE